MSIFNPSKERQGRQGGTYVLEATLAIISAGADERDAQPSFPQDPFQQLATTGVLALPVPDPIGSHGRRASFAEEWCVLRAVARADGSAGRILDGHFNGVERVALLAPEPLRSAELKAIASGDLLLGVWGADPIPGEGEPARLVQGREGQGSPASRPSVPERLAWTARSCSCVDPLRGRPSLPTSTSPKA